MSDPAAAVVVYHDGPARLRACLDSLANQDHPSLRVVLVDHSPDGSGARTAGDATVLRPRENLGFGGGVRAALEAVDAPVALLLNPDARAEPSWARRMSEVLSGSRTGMAAVRVLSGDDPSRLDSAGLGVTRGGMAVLRGHGAPAAATPPASVPLLGPTGAAAAYRRDLLRDLGGFPAAYFLYYEDLEVAFRARRRGWSCGWVDEPLVRHDHVSGAGQRKLYYLQRGRRLFRLRNGDAPWSGPGSALEEAGSWLRAALRGRLGDARRARRDAARRFREDPVRFADDGPVDPAWFARGRAVP